MKKLIISLLVLLTYSLHAQHITTWIGGCPGKETKWNEPRNWNTNAVPDEFSFVIIKQHNSGHASQPVIDSTVEVGSIELHNGSVLTITQTGYLYIVDESNTSNKVIIYGGQLINKGQINWKYPDKDLEKVDTAQAVTNTVNGGK